ncbi:serine/threonine protein kinase [Geomonas sp. Red32]|uniref:serine/threonine protein kinase n=1 Tax=Geomonas sp. Red32 TaxID=2912856 RepID=UPI00202CFF22|nr:serine/threonine-protein kinase [Geomonas sp. Red32]MCM0083917.1 serine/threonine protein kinase [Geomonas sp. Red32]
MTTEPQRYISPYDLHPGQTLDGRFDVIEEISRSGMATIFKASDLTTGQTVAIKVPHLQFESDPGFYSRFVREGEIGARFNHPYLLKFIPLEKQSRPYLVMEYLQGETLAQFLKTAGALPEPQALTMASRICDALSHMHAAQVVHRDLKPQNIMICPDGSIRIFDFGIARGTGRRFTFVGFTPSIGTPEYMAPEQVLGKRGDERTDLYTLGVMLYQIVTGEIPFADPGGDIFKGMNARVTGDPVAPRKVRREISEAAEEIILHAMERDPAGRYPSAEAMKRELDHPESVELTGRWRNLKTPQPWKRYLKSGILVGLLLAAAIALIVWIVLLIVKRGA